MSLPVPESHQRSVERVHDLFHCSIPLGPARWRQWWRRRSWVQMTSWMELKQRPLKRFDALQQTPLRHTEFSDQLESWEQGEGRSGEKLVRWHCDAWRVGRKIYTLSRSSAFVWKSSCRISSSSSSSWPSLRCFARWFVTTVVASPCDVETGILESSADLDSSTALRRGSASLSCTWQKIGVGQWCSC